MPSSGLGSHEMDGLLGSVLIALETHAHVTRKTMGRKRCMELVQRHSHPTQYVISVGEASWPL